MDGVIPTKRSVNAAIASGDRCGTTLQSCACGNQGDGSNTLSALPSREPIRNSGESRHSGAVFAWKRSQGLALVLVLLAALPAVAADVTIENVPGQSDYKVTYSKASDLSGITWFRGENYYVVSNRDAALIPLKLELSEVGAITGAKFGAKIPVKCRLADFEGIAYQPERDRLYVSTERPPGVVGFDREGDATFHMDVPKVFAKALKNKGLESLTFGAGSFWTANEDALEGDGEVSSPGEGALVRLQRFDERFRPKAQFAYQTGTSLFRASKTGTGVTDLAALPGGELLVLERAVGLGISARIFAIDPAGATDTTGIPKLGGAKVTPVKKRLVYERLTGARNFEGMALGPELADGWRSLILIEDNGGGDEHMLIPLRIKVGASGGNRE